MSTQYYLTFNKNQFGEYDVFESHSYGKNNWTTDMPVKTCLPGHIEEFVKEFQKDLEGTVVGFEVDEYIGGN